MKIKYTPTQISHAPVMEAQTSKGTNQLSAGTKLKSMSARADWKGESGRMLKNLSRMTFKMLIIFDHQSLPKVNHLESHVNKRKAV